MRFIYSLIFYFLTPFILCRLGWKSVKTPAYRKRWNERFAFYKQPFNKKTVWFHAVSVGETLAIVRLIKLIQQNHPELNVLITTTTPTGSERVKQNLGDSVHHVYFPYDLPDAVNRFLVHFKPCAAIFVETEIWLNFYTQCYKNHIPVYIINARLSEKSMCGYQKISFLIKPTLEKVTSIAAQTKADEKRFKTLGANQVETFGNVKFDITSDSKQFELSEDLKFPIFKNHWIFIAASTHEGEESVLINAYQNLKNHIPNLLLIIAPRHPERFLTVAHLIRQHNLTLVTRTSDSKCNEQTDVFLLDTLGELSLFYQLCDCAFVGGSFVPIGGHNVLEAVAANVPVIFGQFMHNFQEIALKMLEKQAALQCQNQQDLENFVLSLYQNVEKRHSMTIRAKQFLDENRGATEKIYQLLKKEILKSDL